MLPFSQAADNNKGPIHDVLRDYFVAPGELLEIGAGTGQHAVWLAPRFADIGWTPSEQPDYLDALLPRLAAEPADNLRPAIGLSVQDDAAWPAGPFDYVLTVNTFHIMSRDQVACCIDQACRRLTPGGRFAVYGPFRYGGQPTTDSNRRFDESLRARDPAMGLRDQEWVVARFADHRRALLGDHAMPANNRVLVFG
ncbi:MAG: methylase [Alcanivorax sp.]|nr:methylase [Alcanivorax sp.]MAY11711.1 methylase [Alcanivorax sp.]MBI54462.1 methylase [Alcanivorax sp.]MBM1143555.1 DUF938 domain-containing protein [Alcanivorax sp. ZXX171]MBU59880.1 methylase [Alcanivorax sp.]|tara:strand:+ start:41879 stop:42466 length:588 start_codon:yes stop_codon:yes gene_type:complete